MTLSVDTPSVCALRAWRWIRRVASQTRGARFDGAVVDGDFRLDVDSRGDWHCSHDVEEDAGQLLSIWLPWCTAELTRGPRVIAQFGQSLDGRIATVSGASHYVTGPQSLVHLHQMRALVDAVVVGAGTVDADDPQLTVRHVEGNNPLRVVLDPRGRVPADRQVFCDPAAPTWHLVNEGVAGHDRAEHVSIKSLPLEDSGIDPAWVLSLLAEQGYQRILIEGGGLTISRFLEAGCLDRLHSVVAPMLIGSGRPALTMPEIDTLDHALRPACRHFCLGRDMLFDLDLRDRAATGS